MFVGIAGRSNDVREKLFRPGIAVQDMVFCPLFIIEHKLHGDACLIRPLRMRRVACVATQIPRITLFKKPHCYPPKN